MLLKTIQFLSEIFILILLKNIINIIIYKQY